MVRLVNAQNNTPGAGENASSFEAALTVAFGSHCGLNADWSVAAWCVWHDGEGKNLGKGLYVVDGEEDSTLSLVLRTFDGSEDSTVHITHVPNNDVQRIIQRAGEEREKLLASAFRVMSLREFIATRIEVPDLNKALPDQDLSGPGWVYLGCYYIEKKAEGKAWVILDTDEYDGDLSTLEKLLYRWACREGACDKKQNVATPAFEELGIMLGAAEYWVDAEADEEHPDPMDDVCDLVRDASSTYARVQKDITAARAALQAVYNELDKSPRYNVSDLRLKIVKPALLALGGVA